MGLETLAIIGLAVGAASGAAGSFMQASQANKSARAQADAQRRAIRLQQKQVQQQAAQEREKIVQRAQLIESRIRVAAGESGIGLGGTYEALQRQSDIDAYKNADIVTRNAVMAMERASSEYNPPQTQNPLLAMIFGGMSGAASGLRIAGDVGGMQKPAFDQTTTTYLPTHELQH